MSSAQMSAILHTIWDQNNLGTIQIIMDNIYNTKEQQNLVKCLSRNSSEFVAKCSFMPVQAAIHQHHCHQCHVIIIVVVIIITNFFFQGTTCSSRTLVRSTQGTRTTLRTSSSSLATSPEQSPSQENTAKSSSKRLVSERLSS